MANRQPEIPPLYSGDAQKWAEEMIDYLLRNLQGLQTQIEEIEARVTALEP